MTARQEVKSVETTLPKGLIGRLAGTSYCPEAAIAGGRSEDAATEEQS